MNPKKRNRRIVEEEIIRDQVKELLSKPEEEKKINKRVFEFFNSALGIFILSTVFVSFGSFVYTAVSNRMESTKKKEAEIYKLTNEINYRLEILKKMNKGEFWSGDYYSILCAFFGYEGNRDPKNYYLFKSIYKEFEYRNLNALVVEYRFLQEEKNQYLDDILANFGPFEMTMSTTPFIRGNDKFFRMNSSDSGQFHQRIIEPIESWQRNSLGIKHSNVKQLPVFHPQ